MWWGENWEGYRGGDLVGTVVGDVGFALAEAARSDDTDPLGFTEEPLETHSVSRAKYFRTSWFNFEADTTPFSSWSI